MAPATNKGIIDKPSNHSVEQTVEKLKNILQWLDKNGSRLSPDAAMDLINDRRQRMPERNSHEESSEGSGQIAGKAGLLVSTLCLGGAKPR